jgi:hypothetical protein
MAVRDTFLTKLDANVNNNEIDQVVAETENNVSYFTYISDNLVKGYTENLDILMIRIQAVAIDNEASDDQLEKYVLELSNVLYFVGEKLESMGIRDDLSKLSAKQVYNNSYLENVSKPIDGKKATVAELTANAEEDSRYETIMNNIYARAYRQIKYKVDAAYEMLASLRKVISKRMQEAQLSMQRNNGSLVIGSEEFN